MYDHPKYDFNHPRHSPLDRIMIDKFGLSWLNHRPPWRDIANALYRAENGLSVLDAHKEEFHPDIFDAIRDRLVSLLAF